MSDGLRCQSRDVFDEVTAAPKQICVPKYVTAIVSRIEDRKDCSAIVKGLDEILPIRNRQKTKGNTFIGSNNGTLDTSYAHLRRIRRNESNKIEESTNGPSLKRPRKNIEGKDVSLEVVLHTKDFIDNLNQEEKMRLEKFENLYNLVREERLLPGRPADSKVELEEFNNVWPTIYFHKQSDEHKKEELELSKDEMCSMIRGMNSSITDAKTGRDQYRTWLSETTEFQGPNIDISGAVIINPVDNEVVSTSSHERKVIMKDKSLPIVQIFPDCINPLCTPILLAIQGVSRRERSNAIGLGMSSSEFASGQYLCTGYDLYSTMEPDIYEAMACVHSRFRRVIFGISKEGIGGLGGSGLANAVHSLPGTNHHYRVFKCSNNSENDQNFSKDSIWDQCRKLHRTTSLLSK